MTSSFPKPPVTNRTMAQAIPTPPGLETPVYVKSEVIPDPKAPAIMTPNGELTETEVEMILRTSLLPEHHRDRVVIAFIAAYVACRDVKQASREAGIQTNSGLALRSRPDIHQAITRLTEKSLMKFGFDASEVVEKVKEIAAVDIIEFVNPDGTFKSLHQIPADARRAIKKIKYKSLTMPDPNGIPVRIGEIIELELWSKEKALELLGREKDLFKQTTKVEHDVTKNMKEVLLASKARGEQHSQNMIDVTPVKMIPGKISGDT